MNTLLTTNTLLQDLRFGLRMLRKNPGFTTIAVLSLALGIGANTAIFSVVNTVLLRPLPFRDPERLVMLWNTVPEQGDYREVVSYPDFQDWRQQGHAFEEMALANGCGGALVGPSGAVNLHGASVSSSFFPLLGVKPLLGRLLDPNDDRAGSERVIILSYGLWQREFGGDPGIVGKEVKLDSNLHTVVGVLPPDFRPVHEFLKTAEYWTSLSFYSLMFDQRGNHIFISFARLNPGVTLAAAQSEMDTIAARLATDHPGSNKGRGIAVAALRGEVVGNVRASLWVLFGVVGFTLLIVCANVANLLLAKASAREKEMAIRAALGASLPRLIRQVLSESMLLAVLGGALGLLLAFWGVNLLRPVIGDSIPRSEDLALDGTVLGFALLVSVCTGLLFGVAPALPLLKRNLSASLQRGGRPSAVAGHRAFQEGLVVAEMALTLMLVIGTGLLCRSFVSLMRTELGIQPEHLLTFRVSLPYPETERRQSFWRETIGRMEQLPGVKSVGATSLLPFGGIQAVGFTLLDSHTEVPEHLRSARFDSVSPEYFRAMGIPLAQGRFFDAHDLAGTNGKMVINDKMAKRFWGHQDPLGKHLKVGMGLGGKEPASYEIVGIVRDAKQHRIETDIVPEMFVPFTQITWFEMSFVIRTSVEPTSLIGALRKTIRDLNGEVPVFDVRTMEARIAETVFQRRFSLFMVGAFSVLALFLAALGVYGVMAHSVSVRRQEIGIRMALGAQTSDVLGMILKKGLFLTGVGAALGIGGALAASRLLESLLYGIKPIDPFAFAAGPPILAMVAFLACFVPARRAAKADPMTALRCE